MTTPTRDLAGLPAIRRADRLRRLWDLSLSGADLDDSRVGIWPTIPQRGLTVDEVEELIADLGVMRDAAVAEQVRQDKTPGRED